jgi:ribosomal protein S7
MECKLYIPRLARKLVYSRLYDKYEYLSFRYNQLFLRSLIRHGCKLRACRYYSELRYRLKCFDGRNPDRVLLHALIEITPCLVLMPIRLGGIVQGVPFSIKENKCYTYAVKWVIKLLRDKYRRLDITLLTETLVGAIQGTGASMEKKREVYLTAMKNRHLLRFFRRRRK